MKNLKFAISVAALMATTAVVNAFPTTDTLANLVATHGSLQIADKIFSNFGYLDTDLSTFNPTKINVVASKVGDVEFLTWNGKINLVGTAGDTADLLLTYRVTATAGSIDWIDQSYTGSAAPKGKGFITVDESVYAGSSFVANSHLEIGDLTDEPGKTEVGDDIYISPSKTVLDVTKDIGFALLADGFVTISQVRQSFHQSTTKVPDGGTTLAMLGLALLGVEGMRRSVRK